MNMVTFTQSALVLIREGAEALLIIAALAAYLNRTGVPEKTRILYWGAGLAVGLSIFTAIVFVQFFDGGHSDLVEGVSLLLAAAILLYVSGWLFTKRDAEQWQGYLQDKTEQAIGSRGLWALGAVAFFAVFREGAETILFLHALAINGNGWSFSLLSGVLAGSVFLVAIYFAVRKLALRLPLKPFFIGTAVFLYALAVLFAGQGIQEFQEMGWISFSELSFIPGWLAELGVNPSMEGFSVQALLILAVPLAIAFEAKRRPASSEA